MQPVKHALLTFPDRYHLSDSKRSLPCAQLGFCKAARACECWSVRFRTDTGSARSRGLSRRTTSDMESHTLYTGDIGQCTIAHGRGYYRPRASPAGDPTPALRRPTCMRRPPTSASHSPNSIQISGCPANMACAMSARAICLTEPVTSTASGPASRYRSSRAVH